MPGCFTVRAILGISGTLHRGVMYAKRDNVKVERYGGAVPRLLFAGYTDKDILDHVNRYENIHEFFTK